MTMIPESAPMTGGLVMPVPYATHHQAIAALMVTYIRLKSTRGEWWGDTIRVNRARLFDFAAFLPRQTRVDRVKREQIEAWLDSRAERTAASSRGRLSAVRGFFRWLHTDGRIPRDPTVGVVAPDVPDSAPRRFTDVEVEQLFATARRHPRDLLVISFEWNEGLRRIEVARALIEDVNWSTLTLSVRGKFHRGKVSHAAALSPETVEALKSYLGTVRVRSGPIVRSQRDPELGVGGHTIWKITDSVLKDAGLKWHPFDGRSCHAGRHTAATEALEAGVPVEILKRQHGWQSDAPVMRYTRAAALPQHEIHAARAARRAELRRNPGCAIG